MAWLLNAAYVALLLAVSPLLLYRSWTQGKYRSGWGQKLWGHVPVRRGDSRCLWLHAVSVGEVLQLQPVLESLAVDQPDLQFVISTTTATGYEVACQRYARHQVIYLPLDFSWAVRTALQRIRPSAIVLVELELWPNFIREAARQGIPVGLINARISERSFRGYRRIRPVMRSVLRRMTVCGVQNATYAERLLELGAAPEQLVITGSIKFDGVETDRRNLRTQNLRSAFGLQPDETVFIAGSTQDPEEELALQSYLQLRATHPRLRLMLVPRHRERFEEVARLVTERFQVPLIRRSQVQGGESPNSVSASAPPAVLLLDTLGELAAAWGLADVAFVGGSLTSRGGQNMIEPAGYGAAVMFGPNTRNFRDVVEILLREEAAIVVRDGAELTAQLDRLLSCPNEAHAMGQRAQRLVTEQRGATQRTVQVIRQYCAPEGAARAGAGELGEAGRAA